VEKLEDWLLDRMAAYRGGGVPYREAARWTYGELLAVYKGRHWRGGEPTKAPDIPAAAALGHAGAVLRELEGAYRGGIKPGDYRKT
jgi:hypothetical protein